MWPKLLQIEVIFSHLKLWIAVARHNFKWLKIKIEHLTQNPMGQATVVCLCAAVCRAKPKASICLLYKWADTAFWLCKEFYAVRTLEIVNTPQRQLSEICISMECQYQTQTHVDTHDIILITDAARQKVIPRVIPIWHEFKIGHSSQSGDRGRDVTQPALSNWPSPFPNVVKR